MRTIDFSQVLFNALQFSGNDRHNLNDDTFAQFRDFSGFRLREIWEAFPWPDICRLKPFTKVESNGLHYFVPDAESDEIIGVYHKNPLTTTRAVKIPYSQFNDGTDKIVIDPSTDEGFYAYRIACPELTGTKYGTTVIYSKGAQIYFDSGSGTGTLMPVEGKPHYGNFYECIADAGAAQGESPATHASKWRKVQIPYIFGPYLSWGSTTNWLLSEGMVQEAAVVETKAKEAMELELDKATRQQNQNDRLNMIQTY